MGNKNQPRKERSTTDNSGDDKAPANWQGEDHTRHKWFRKGKKHPTARRRQFDDDFESDGENEEDDEEEDAHDGPGWHFAGSRRSSDSHAEGRKVMEIAAEQDAWGIASAIDIYECDPELIRDAVAIRRFVVDLCDLIEMKRFGETQVVHFGEDDRVAGYSMVQLIETSLISAHFANQSNAVYLDVFSCKPYNPQVVREFSQAFFGGRDSSVHVAIRR